MRLTTKTTYVLSNDLDQSDLITGPTSQTVDDTNPTEQGAVVVKLNGGAVTYTQIALPAGMTHVGHLMIETDSPILVRLNTADGLSGTEIPVTPILTPAISQPNPAPSPQVSPSVQPGQLMIRAGLSVDGITTFITTVWIKNPYTTAATVRVRMVGE